MPIIAHFPQKNPDGTTNYNPAEQYENQEVVVGISLSQDYHKDVEKILALFRLLKKTNFQRVHLVVPGELEGLNLMIDDSTLDLDSARQAGRAKAEKWLQDNNNALKEVPKQKLTTIYFDEILQDNQRYKKLEGYFKGLRTVESKEYDKKFAKKYDETKGAFIANCIRKRAKKGVISSEEYARIGNLVEQYIDGELIQLQVWAEEGRPYAHIVYPKEKPPVMAYYYEKYLKPKVGETFSDLIYATDQKSQKKAVKAVDIVVFDPEKVYASFSRDILAMESCVDELSAQICKLKAKAKRAAISGDQREVETAQRELAKASAIFKRLTGYSPQSGSPNSSPSSSPPVASSLPKILIDGNGKIGSKSPMQSVGFFLPKKADVVCKAASGAETRSPESLELPARSHSCPPF